MKYQDIQPGQKFVCGRQATMMGPCPSKFQFTEKGELTESATSISRLLFLNPLDGPVYRIPENAIRPDAEVELCD